MLFSGLFCCLVWVFFSHRQSWPRRNVLKKVTKSTEFSGPSRPGGEVSDEVGRERPFASSGDCRAVGTVCTG